MIRKQSLRIKAFENNANELFTFKASDGLFFRFLKRNKFSHRKISTSRKDLSKDFGLVVQSFLSECKMNF